MDGTPTDCVHLGVFNLTGGATPDLVLSGINRGLNVGDDVTYSGTVAGALEATLLRDPRPRGVGPDRSAGAPDYARARSAWPRLARRAPAGEPCSPGVFLNVNVPRASRAGIRITRQGTRTYRAAVVERLDPSGRPYFWIAGADTTPSGEPDGDHRAIEEGYVSVTPASRQHDPRPLAAGPRRLEPGAAA